MWTYDKIELTSRIVKKKKNISTFSFHFSLQDNAVFYQN